MTAGAKTVDDRACIICLEGGDNLLHGGCVCRGGAAGFWHVACLAKYASISLAEACRLAQQNPAGIDRIVELIKKQQDEDMRWTHCGTCHQGFTGDTAVLLAKARCSSIDKYTLPKAVMRRVQPLVLGQAGQQRMNVIMRLQADSQLAEALRGNSQYEEAIPLMERCLATARRTFGNAHPETAIRAADLGTMYNAVGNYNDALPLFEEAVTSSRLFDSSNDPSEGFLKIRTNMIGLLCNLGQTEKAFEMGTETLAQMRRVLGDDNENTLISAAWLAQMMVDQGNVSAAHDLAHEVVVRRRRIFGEDHVGTIISVGMYAKVLLTQERYGQADEILTRTLATARRVLGEENENTQILAADLDALQQALTLHFDRWGMKHSALARVVDIQSKTDLNGLFVSVLKYLPEKDRYRCCVFSAKDLLGLKTVEGRFQLCETLNATEQPKASETKLMQINLKPRNLVAFISTSCTIQGNDLNGLGGVIRRYDPCTSLYLVVLNRSAAQKVELSPECCQITVKAHSTNEDDSTKKIALSWMENYPGDKVLTCLQIAALCEAAGRGDLRKVNRLLDKHAELIDLFTPPEFHGGAVNALRSAVSGNRLRVARLLLDRGADPNSSTPEKAFTPLMRAATLGYSALVQLLLERGAKVNQVNDQGLTALHGACGSFASSVEVVQALLDANCDISIRGCLTCGEFTALQIAERCSCGQDPARCATIIRMLRQRQHQRQQVEVNVREALEARLKAA
eukprot:COSAG03_NODE_76_length_14245_cov_10.406122_7_plen_740_part_00